MLKDNLFTGLNSVLAMSPFRSQVFNYNVKGTHAAYKHNARACKVNII